MRFREGNRKATLENDKKLCKASFIKKVKYLTWLANVVIVKS